MTKKSVCFNKDIGQIIMVERMITRPSERCHLWYTTGEILRNRLEHPSSDCRELLARRKRCVQTVLARQEQYHRDESSSSSSSSGSIVSSLSRVSQACSKIDRMRARKNALDTARSLGLQNKKDRMEVSKVVKGTFQGSVTVIRSAMQQSHQCFLLSRFGRET